MPKRTSSCVLVGLILHAALLCAPAPSRAQAGEESESAVRARVTVKRLGAETRVQVRLRDGRSLTGHIDRIGEEDFALADAKTGADVSVAYADVLEVRRKNKGGLSTGMKLLIIFTAVGFVGGLLNPS